MSVDDPGILTGLGGFLSAAVALLRGESRAATAARQLDTVEKDLRAELATRVREDLCSSRRQEALTAQNAHSRELSQLRRQVETGFREVKALIRNGGRDPT